jgi:hypothetical protein
MTDRPDPPVRQLRLVASLLEGVIVGTAIYVVERRSRGRAARA